MKENKEQQILESIKRSDPPKKRVTFFITENSKSALANWCKKHSVSESSAIDEMIKASVPDKYFKEKK